MARLNDAATPLDPVELLRRKYSRQNKEIARINSTQCIRIRNLENEVSRLLAENLNLREQILRLETEADSRNSREVVDHVNAIKANLEAKLFELGTLVTALGDIPPPKKKPCSKGEKTVRPSSTQSPDQKNWKNMCTLSEAVGLQDGKLPPILEDKSYPRRTLEPSEIQDLFLDPAGDNTDSPDIGPPPVSQFINEDPVKIDLPTRSNGNKGESSEIDPARSINLEQRRKRRDSAAPAEQKRNTGTEPGPSQSGKDMAQSLKIGAKRKLSTRDDEDGASNMKPTQTSPDDFKYTRRSIEEQPQIRMLGATENKPSKTQRDFAVAKGVHREKTSSTTQLTTRRALGPKTANIDLANSPQKHTRQGLSDDTSSEKGGILRKDQLKERPRDRKPELPRIKGTADPVVTTTNVEPEPETPAAPDAFSPIDSGSSAIRANSRDTPPPPDLDPGMEGQRPSRRARGSVSYAEPNLRDKMRRPTKELVDAVAGEGKAQRLSIVKPESDAPTTARKIKAEPEADDAWKNMPSVSMVNEYSKSPLIDKINSKEAMPGSLTIQRHRRRSSIHQVNEGELPRSGSSTAISTLLAGPRKFRQEQSECVEAKDSLDGAMAKLDIYEFTGSSPREPSDSKIPTVKAEWPTSRTRRPSSNAQDPSTISNGEISDGEQTTRSHITSSRRRQSMIGMTASTSDIESASQKQGEELRKSSSHSILNEGSEARSERVSARRRSMML